MKVSELYIRFPDESTCKQIMKIVREKAGVICKKCGGKEYYWKNDKECFECKICKFRTSLKSGTIMENSKLPVNYWILAIFLFEITKNAIPALELQKVFRHKRYEPIWLMCKKIKNTPKKDNFIYELLKYIKVEEVSQGEK